MKEICSLCGRSVAQGSGLFVDRVFDADSEEEGRELERPFPEGGYICRECDAGETPFDCFGEYDHDNPNCEGCDLNSTCEIYGKRLRREL